jgi:hypothetical protein
MKRWSGGLVALACLAAGCNLIFGITGGTPGTTSSGTTGGGGAASSSSASSSRASTSATTSGGGGGQAPALEISPASADLLALTTLTFTATAGGKPAAVTWSVVDPGGGTVTSPGGVYSAPQVDGTFHVQATLGSQTKQANVTVHTTAAPTLLVSTGELPTATGHGSQSHLAYAEGTAEWWLFHDPAAGGQLATLFSSDGFMTWQPGESINFAPEPGPDGDGRNLSVAYRSLGGHDVVHVSQGYFSPPDGGTSTQGRYHIRGILSAGHVAFGPPESINSLGASDPWSAPDGCVTAILPDGRVLDSSGVVGTGSLNPPASLGPCGVGDAEAFTSVGKDDGSSPFNSAAFSPTVLWCVPGVLGSHQLLTVGSDAILLFDDGGSAPPGNVLVGTYQNGAWSPAQPNVDDAAAAMIPPSAFASGASIGFDDWTGAVQNGAVHVVRRTDSGFDHAILPSVGGAWMPGGSIEPLSTLPDSGLFLAPYGDGLILVALSPDDGSQLVYTYYDGSTWSMWSFLTQPSSDQRNYVSGYAPASGAKPAVIWTVTEGQSYGIGGLLLP